MRARIHPLDRPLQSPTALRVPGDKSISHRSLMMAALAKGESRIAGLAGGADVRSTARVLAQLGIPLLRGDGTPWMPGPRSELSGDFGDEPTFMGPQRPQGSAKLPARDPDMGPDDAIVFGQGLDGLRAPTGPLDCGNSGTTLRLMMGILAGAGIEATLIGDQSLSRRPMERVAKPLRLLGAEIECSDKGRPPVRVHGGKKLRGAAVKSELSSAQVKSAVLLAGLFAEGQTSFEEPMRSRDHTERFFSLCGIPLERAGHANVLTGPVQPQAFALDVPGDLSSAAFLLAAVLASPQGSKLELAHVGVNPTRAGFLDALAAFGAKSKLSIGGGSTGPLGAGGQPLPGAGAFAGGGEPVGALSIEAQPLRGAELDEALVLRAIDEVPMLSVLGALAEGRTTIRGASELRVKESDRLAQMAMGLRAMGATVEELPDGLIIDGVGPGKKLHGATIDSAHDHRIALAFSIAALAADSPTTISGAEWADVSYPGFFSLLGRLGARVELIP
ncbi:MAG: 3-phosphoshikimate 1-carboxyvinyltransferase [Deltaproteobacteria bacterium]|nr:3-phosphoshikimate 1-carboxyvinyltransferase [Deltaproteobacteria bacterium]